MRNVAPSAKSDGQSSTSPLGRIISRVPQKPIATAVQRRQPTRSPRNCGASAVRMIGEANMIAVMSASGICLIATMNMKEVTTANRPRASCAFRFTIRKVLNPLLRDSMTAIGMKTKIDRKNRICPGG